MNIGKSMRLKRLFHYDDTHTIIVPMDHGITLGPIDGITDIAQTINTLSKLQIDGIVLHKGIITSCHDTIVKSDLPIIMHLSASTKLGDKSTKVLVGDVNEAVSFACCAVSVQINFGTPNESAMLRDVALVSEKCYKYGMPLLIMAYHENCDTETVSHISRICAELGADLIKVPYVDNFNKVILGCPIPIIVSGGEFANDVLDKISQAMICGASGVAVGRNIFQSKNMEQTIKKIVNIVRKEKSK
ncbi:2-amino-3,7-dideoxy-D-threo-hept-6-ulosonate synthase [Bacteroidia bacterium]|nr:2-amino-3,7-dideoxy-D-threo-hept-6-ulosonate synthase [Bacteroidia bacterium]